MVQRVISLVEIHKYILQDLTPQAPNLLEYFFLQGGHPYPLPHPEPLQNVMEIDGLFQAPFNYYGNEFPKNLRQYNSMVIYSALGEERGGVPSALY